MIRCHTKKKFWILMSQTKHSIRVRFIYLISWREFVGWWLVYLIKNSQPLISSSGANYFWLKSFVGNVHLLNQDWLFNRHFIPVTIESYFGSFIIAFVLEICDKIDDSTLLIKLYVHPNKLLELLKPKNSKRSQNYNFLLNGHSSCIVSLLQVFLSRNWIFEIH